MDNAPGVAKLIGGAKRQIRWGTITRHVVRTLDERVEVDGVGFETHSTGPGSWILSNDNGIERVWVAGPADAPWVFLDGRVYIPEIVDAPRHGRRDHADAGGLGAPMPATVRAVLVSVGDQVTEGQTLVVLEAMKMELPLRAPRMGRVAQVRCAPGELVQPGAPLVELE